MANAKPNRMTVEPTPSTNKEPAAPGSGLLQPQSADKGYSDKELANGDVIRTYLSKV